MTTILLVLILLVNAGLIWFLLRGFEQLRRENRIQQAALIGRLQEASVMPDQAKAENGEYADALVQEALLMRCLHGAYPDREDLLADLNASGMTAAADMKPMAAVFSMAPGQSLPIPGALAEQVRAHLAENQYAVLPWHGGAVLAVAPAELQEELLREAAAVIRHMGDTWAVDVVCGVSDAAASLHMLSRLVQQAETACRYRRFEGTRAVILYQDIAQREQTDPVYPDIIHRSLRRNLRQFNELPARRDLETFFSAMEECSIRTALMCVGHVVSLLCLRIQRSELPPPAETDYLHVMRRIEAAATLSQMHGIVLELADAYFALNPGRVNRQEDAIDAILAYMEAHYMEASFSANDLKNILHYSDNHIRNLFKDAYQCTPTEYLFQLRLRKAKELLAETDAKISDVAEMVGYSNAKYFYSLFKKHVGMTMNQYRIFMGNGQDALPPMEREEEQ